MKINEVEIILLELNIVDYNLVLFSRCPYNQILLLIPFNPRFQDKPTPALTVQCVKIETKTFGNHKWLTVNIKEASSSELHRDIMYTSLYHTLIVSTQLTVLLQHTNTFGHVWDASPKLLKKVNTWPVVTAGVSNSLHEKTRTNLVVLHIPVCSVLQKHKSRLHIINRCCPVQSGFA